MKRPVGDSQEEPSGGAEKREFLRLPYEYPLKFSVCRKGPAQGLEMGTARNVSQNGLLFSAAQAPPVDSVILIETDLKMLASFIEVKDALMELRGRILAKVVRVVPSHGSLYEVGVQFIRAGEEKRPEVARALGPV